MLCGYVFGYPWGQCKRNYTYVPVYLNTFSIFKLISVALSWISKALSTNLGENTHLSRKEKACIYFEERTDINSPLEHWGFKRVLREKLLGISDL